MMDPRLDNALRKAKRVIVIIVGFTILLVGVAMIVLPGPAIVFIPLGLGILGTELLWAKKLLNKIKDKFPKKGKENDNASKTK